ncbi:MAG: hypothetical protein ACRDWT_05850 [Jatrophihabitantaceae bacterium]
MATPSMLVIDTHLARGASNGGTTLHDHGSPFGVRATASGCASLTWLG